MNCNGFKISSRQIFSTLKSENIQLNFRGYDDLFEKLSFIEEFHVEELSQLSIEIEMWLDYMNELRCILHQLMKSIENKGEYFAAFEDPLRYNAQLDGMIKENDEKYKQIALYFMDVLEQIKFLRKMKRFSDSLIDELTRKYNR